MSTLSHVDRAGGWFLRSGIQEPSGGVARYYRADSRQNLAVSTEITAYAASTLVYLHSLTGDPKYLDRAVQAAGFLAHQAWDTQHHTIPFESNGHKPLAYFFDCGIIVRGLLAVWRETHRDEFLEVAGSCARSMARDFSDGNGGFHPVLSLPDKVPLAYDPQWSRSPGCYQLKSALAWVEAADAVGDGKLRAFYERQLQYALATHERFLPGDENPHRVMDRLHAYSYFLEALLVADRGADCAATIRLGIDSVARYLREIGPLFERSDVYAQLLRIRCLAAWAGVAPMDHEAAAFEAGRLALFQLDDTDARVCGGFTFGRKGKVSIPHMNPVSTGFALQALVFWDQLQRGEPAPPSLLLI